MIRPGTEHPDYKKNIATLEKQGYRHFTADEVHSNLHVAFMNATVLVNEKGALKAVNLSTGKVSDVKPPQP